MNLINRFKLPLTQIKMFKHNGNLRDIQAMNKDILSEKLPNSLQLKGSEAKWSNSQKLVLTSYQSKIPLKYFSELTESSCFFDDFVEHNVFI